jgi:hypothetical protein
VKELGKRRRCCRELKEFAESDWRVCLTVNYERTEIGAEIALE